MTTKLNINLFRIPIRLTMDDVSAFITRRFSGDCNWLSGNCYYFAVILKTRFPEGIIWYDVFYGHFYFQFGEKFYDWEGEVIPKGKLVEWDAFKEYDSSQRERIVRDCIM